jgi:GNAT superfamily N-acetyltransferase
LIRYRPFENWDPPALAEIWRTQRPIRGRMQTVTPQALEQHVLAKPWFDRHGLIVACDGARPVGFAHGGFGADCEQRGVDCSQGTTCLLLIAPHEERPAIARELLSASEDYLRRRGALQLFAGSQFPLNPFYLGLYGSSDTAGVLSSNKGFVELLEASGYEPKQRRVMTGRPLAAFRPPIDRQQMQVRRRFKVAGPIDVLPDNWWDACVWALHELSRFDLVLEDGGEPIISATFWDIDPLAVSWGVRTVGLVKLDDTPEAREQGLSVFLLADVLKQYQTAGYAHFEAQAAAEDASLRDLFEQLGLVEYDDGALWLKRD